MSAASARISLPSQELSNVQLLRPIRVLLAGREVRYIRAVAFLFERQGCETCVSLRPSSILTDVESFQPEVVVLVEGASFAEAVGQATALIEGSDRLGVVLVTSRPEAPAAERLRFVAKWSAFTDLAGAVERAWLELPAPFSFKV